MTAQPKDVLLGWLRGRGQVILAGNREYFDCIDFMPPDRFIRYGGDSMTNEEECRHEIDEQEAYLLLLRYWRDESTRFGGPELPTEESVAEYVRSRAYL